MSKTTALAIGRLGIVVVGILVVAAIGCFLASIWLESVKFFATGGLFVFVAFVLGMTTSFWYGEVVPDAVETKEKGGL